MQGQAAASLALQEALAATKEAAQHVDETVSILQQVQVGARSICRMLVFMPTANTSCGFCYAYTADGSS